MVHICIQRCGPSLRKISRQPRHQLTFRPATGRWDVLEAPERQGEQIFSLSGCHFPSSHPRHSPPGKLITALAVWASSVGRLCLKSSAFKRWLPDYEPIK